MTFQTDGPEQGITIETEGKVYRISPSLVDENERAVLGEIQGARREGSEMLENSDPLFVDVLTLRMLMAREVSLREQKEG